VRGGWLGQYLFFIRGDQFQQLISPPVSAVHLSNLRDKVGSQFLSPMLFQDTKDFIELGPLVIIHLYPANRSIRDVGRYASISNFVFDPPEKRLLKIDPFAN
jgi:hypothetical protein